MSLAIYGEQVGDGSAGPVQEWLKTWVAVRFPNLGVEYWSDNRYAKHGLKPYTPLPLRIDHAGAYVYRGRSEGYILSVVLATLDDGPRCLAWAKVFDSPDTLWSVAHTITSALNELFLDRRVPPLQVPNPQANGIGVGLA